MNRKILERSTGEFLYDRWVYGSNAQSSLTGPAMKHLIKKNRWECLLYSVAMAADISPERLVKELGHDGSKIVDPSLPDPQCRQGFHIQEFQHVLYTISKEMAPMQFLPVSQVGKVRYPIYENIEQRVNTICAAIRTNRGIITGETLKGNGHAVAFEHGVVFDPDGLSPYHFTLEESCDRNFYPKEAWVMV